MLNKYPLWKYKYPLWKYLLILMVCTLGVIYAMPNLYPPDPAVQITPAKSGDVVDDYTLNRALSVLKEANIQYFGEEIKDGKTALIRRPKGLLSVSWAMVSLWPLTWQQLPLSG